MSTPEGLPAHMKEEVDMDELQKLLEDVDDHVQKKTSEIQPHTQATGRKSSAKFSVVRKYALERDQRRSRRPRGPRPKPPSILSCLAGSSISGVMGYYLLQGTISIGSRFAAQPVSWDSYTVHNITTAVRTAILGGVAMFTGVFLFSSVGLFLLALQIAIKGPDSIWRTPVYDEDELDAQLPETAVFSSEAADSDSDVVDLRDDHAASLSQSGTVEISRKVNEMGVPVTSPAVVSADAEERQDKGESWKRQLFD
eukprot:CAMPEP_0196668090 /NCGR_PEP_ID=MMETSP1086-20130531/65437_1 /TAXON_ID=77921 /ORGANISM="Cyanoptyche  gloeocystis , Strain SAG4.97" /LENGTH=253 /DNA_ID=CAMNT_0042005475 /DNA_START=164 /DNA_END=925 /DNA_ORIENTATION=-